MEYRKEKDLIGLRDIPKDSYTGIHTLRALENFNITKYTTSMELIKAYAMVKKACCQANYELEYISKAKYNAINSACDEIIESKFLENFPIDPLQGGAGTSTNMNLNEVIANRALEILGENKGNYSKIHPIEDVNLHQSTNDTYPTALKISVINEVQRVSRSIEELQRSLQKKEKEFSSILTVGRTELGEAAPILLGSIFGAFASSIARDRWRTYKCEERLREVNLGGTVIGTGLAAPQSYIFLVIEKLREITGLGLTRGDNVIDQTANLDVFVEVSGILKANAVTLIKISDDLRKHNANGEIILPAVQSGSSIVPGKVNPVIIESVIQAAIKVKANDMIIADAASRGSHQINEFLPLISFAILESLEILNNINLMLSNHVEDIKADQEKCREIFSSSHSIITALIPHIGYEKAEECIKLINLSKEKDLLKILEKVIEKELLNKIFLPESLSSLGYKN